MPAVRKRLGSVEPAATTETDLYVVPAATDAVVSRISVCNRGAAGTFRVAVTSGAAAADADWLFYDCPIAVGETVLIDGGTTMAAAFEIHVYASHADFAFNCFGQENS